MAATKTMTIRVTLDGQNDLRFTAKQTKPNLAVLTEAFGEAHVIIPRNPWGSKGAPKSAAKTVKAAAAKVKASKPRAKRTTAPKPAASVKA